MIWDISYWLKRTPWDTGVTPPELVSLVDRHFSQAGRAIDIGCGTGTNVVYLARRGFSVFGIDISRRAVAMARRRVQDAGVSAEVRVGSATRLSELAGGSQFDLAVDMCLASWRSSAGSLPCPGNPSSAAGSVVLTFKPTFENNIQENEATLWTRPETKVGGWIQGVYPPYTIRSGDQFVSQIGCLKDSQGCEVTFTLDYILPNGTVRNLGQWYEVYDGNITTIRVDLSSLAGNPVQFILLVTAVNNPSKANAFWFVPSVRHVAPTPTSTATRPPNTPTATLTVTASPTLSPPTFTATASPTTETPPTDTLTPTATQPVYP